MTPMLFGVLVGTEGGLVLRALALPAGCAPVDAPYANWTCMMEDRPASRTGISRRAKLQARLCHPRRSCRRKALSAVSYQGTGSHAGLLPNDGPALFFSEETFWTERRTVRWDWPQRTAPRLFADSPDWRTPPRGLSGGGCCRGGGCGRASRCSLAACSSRGR